MLSVINELMRFENSGKSLPARKSLPYEPSKCKNLKLDKASIEFGSI